MAEHPGSTEPATIIRNPGPEYQSPSRQWQGIPGIERAANGRLWATWYSGGPGEGCGNYVVLVTSGDDGSTWTEPVLAVVTPPTDRAFDCCLWHDPLGRLWLFWAQAAGQWFDGRAGVWAICTANSDSADPTFTDPRRLCNGIMMNKPTVLSTGEWLLPAAVWDYKEPKRPELAEERFSNVVCSTDDGETFTRRGGADVPERAFDEHTVVERRNGDLWMLVRTKYGIGESVSHDRGFTWTPGRPTDLFGPNSRFFIRRLRSGRLVLVNHKKTDVGPHEFRTRSHLTAWLSEDDGATWIGELILDERTGVSYPDGLETEDGLIYVVYDHNRGGPRNPDHEREILMAVFREEDVLARHCVSPDARMKVLVNRV